MKDKLFYEWLLKSSKTIKMEKNFSLRFFSCIYQKSLKSPSKTFSIVCINVLNSQIYFVVEKTGIKVWYLSIMV